MSTNARGIVSGEAGQTPQAAGPEGREPGPSGRAQDLIARISELEQENERLRAVLIKARDELNGLPRSLGYDFTHLPEIDAAIDASIRKAQE